MSPLPGRVEDGLWTGALSELGGLTGVDELCLACERLRFTGRLRLLASDGELQLEAQWAGGEVAEVEDAADEATLMSFMPPPGTMFEVVQGMPGLDGVLVDQRELAGALTPGLVQRLYELCAKARLSAKVVLRGGPPASPPAGAEFRFIQGRVTTATIAGEEQAALPALAALSTWTAGEFFVHVDPCFEAPPSSTSLHGAPQGSAPAIPRPCGRSLDSLMYRAQLESHGARRCPHRSP